MNLQETASKKLADNLNKIVKIALSNYHKQSTSYRKNVGTTAHVERLAQHFYKGFYLEAKREQAVESNISFAKTFGLIYKPQRTALRVA